MKKEETKAMEKVEDKKSKESLSSIWNKTADLSKKAAGEIQKGAKIFAEQTKKTIHDQRVKWYNPLFPKDFKSKNFNLPNIIEIVDDAVRRDIDICEGAIGWIDKINDVEILHLYDEWVEKSGITFIPVWKCDNVYCVDNFNRKRFVNMNSVFAMASEERMAELENIAYSLGAVRCSIEIVESSVEIQASSTKANNNKVGAAEIKARSQNSTNQSGKIESRFHGSDEPKRPQLKWFSHDENIKGLIEMRCSDINSIKSKVLILQGSSATTMSKKIACALDKIAKVKGSMSMERQAVKEHSSKLVYEIEF